MRNFFRFCLMALCLTFTGCAAEWCNFPEPEEETIVKDSIPMVHEPVTESTDEYELSYQYQDGVVVLTDSLQQLVTKIEADTILYLSDRLPATMMPVPGDIWTAAASPTLPYGLGCRIESVEKITGGYKVVTAPATLEEIFQDLVITGELPLYSSDNDTRAAIGKDKLFVFDKQIKIDEDIYWDGKIELGYKLNMDINLKKMKYDISLTVNYDYGYHMGFMAETAKEIVLHTFKGMDLKAIKIGALVVRPSMDLSISIGANGKIQAGISNKYGAVITWGVKDGTTYRSEEMLNSQDDVINQLEWDGKGSFYLNVDPTVNLGFYTKKMGVKVNPRMQMKAEADFSLNNGNLLTDTHELKASIDIELHASLNSSILWLDKISNFMDSPTFNIWSTTLPMSPTLVSQDNGYDMLGKNQFQHSFVLDGCPMLNYQTAYPYLAVYRDGKLINRYISERKLTGGKGQLFTFIVDKLDTDNQLYLCPGVIIAGVKHEASGKTVTFDQPDYQWNLIDFHYDDNPHRMYWYDEYIQGSWIEFCATFDLKGSENLYEFGVKYKQPREGKTEMFTSFNSNKDGKYMLKGKIICFKSVVPLEFQLYVRENRNSEEKIVGTFFMNISSANNQYPGNDIATTMSNCELRTVEEWESIEKEKENN